MELSGFGFATPFSGIFWTCEHGALAKVFVKAHLSSWKPEQCSGINTEHGNMSGEQSEYLSHADFGKE